MENITKFEKVSFSQFWGSVDKKATQEPAGIREMYNAIPIPKRATTGSAGYDFATPYGFTLAPGETIKIPTGIRAKMNDGLVLMLFPRSSLGFKYRLQLDNTVGVVDADYYNSDNEGHIFIKMTNDGEKTLEVKAGDRIAQGIFLPFFVTADDETNGVRNGGFGSTN